MNNHPASPAELTTANLDIITQQLIRRIQRRRHRGQRELLRADRLMLLKLRYLYARIEAEQ